MPDCTDAEAAAFIRDAGAKLGALVTLCAQKAQFYEFVSAEELLEFGEKLGRETVATYLEGGLEDLSEAAEMGALGAGERKVVHEAVLKKVADGAERKALFF